MGYIKTIKTGNFIEVFSYEREPVSVFRVGGRKSGTAPKSPYERERPKRRRSDSANRAKQSFWRIVRGGLSKGTPSLLTLTMLDIVGIRDAYKCYTSFGQKIRRTFGNGISWVGVPEFQKRGAVHFHILIWGLPDELSCRLGASYSDKSGKRKRKHICATNVLCERNTRRLAALWPWGWLDLVATDGNPRLAGYLSKYMTKALFDERLAGQKSYTRSRGMPSPQSFSKPVEVDVVFSEFLTPLPVVDFERSYGTMWLGRCDYKRYIIEP